MKPSPAKQSTRSQGFSLISAIVSVAVLAIVASVGVATFQGFSGSVKSNKLKTDIANINSALKVYKASGGDLDSLSEPQAIINKLKTAAADTQHKRVVGLRETMADPRLAVVMQTAAEAATDQPRALWDTQKQRFVIADSGAAGIKELALDDSISAEPASQEARDMVVAYADNSTWVWNYTDRNLDPTTAPSNYAASNPPSPPGAPGSVFAQPLDPPQLSLPSGVYPLGDYSLAVSITDPNPPGISNILYSIDSGDWYVYNGTPIDASPGTTILAMTVSLDPDAWIDSEPEQGDYLTTPVEPLLAFSVPDPSVTYAEAGGAMIGGGPGAADPGTITLTNPSAIPTPYQIDSVFSIHWTYDGSDPLTSPTRLDGDSFSGGFPGQEVDYLLNRWGSGTTLPIKVVAESENPLIVTDSQVVTTNLSVDPIVLREPSVSEFFLGSGTQTISINLETAYGDMPEGARIYYTTDGTDPGVDSGGNPLGGTLYEGPFEHDVNGTTAVAARVYGPSGYPEWFTPSSPHIVAPSLPVIAFTMSVSTTAP